MPVRSSITEMQEFAASKGGRCLSKEYWGSLFPLTWRCRKGHSWEAPPKIIMRGAWCVQCVKEEVKEDQLEKLQQIAESKGGKCLSEKYINNHSKLSWQCKQRHRWEAPSKGILKGHWCPACAGMAKLTIEVMQALAAKKGGQCLSRKYLRNSIPLEWECSEGHRFKARPDLIKNRGQWCYICHMHRKKAEYGGQKIVEMRKLARQRGGRCLSDFYETTADKLTWRCSRRHVWRAAPAGIKQGSWCPVCARKARGTIEEMRQMAGNRGGKCLSTHYINNSTKLEWQCSKGHRWAAIPTNVKTGSWCPVCAIDIIKMNLPSIRKWHARPS